MSYDTNRSEFARVTVDALAGAGFVLREGDVIDRQVLGDHFDVLLQNGAVELCESAQTSERPQLKFL